ncbi:MAG TPA: hypothetical protein VI685_16660 [Candidatus Angelobacter sp.]
MNNNAQSGLPSDAFQVWMSQWQLSALDTEGCMFVLRFLLRSFSARRPEDRFWKFLAQFLFSEEDQQKLAGDENLCTAKDLLGHAGTLNSDHARALVAYLGECYAEESDRLFWTTVSEAIQLYTVAPYTGRAAGTA